MREGTKAPETYSHHASADCGELLESLLLGLPLLESFDCDSSFAQDDRVENVRGERVSNSSSSRSFSQLRPARAALGDDRS